MQHTLIPLNERKRLHRQYATRVVIVSLCVASGAVLVGAGALFPSFVRAWYSTRAFENAVVSEGKNTTDAAVNEAKNRLESAHQLLAVLLKDRNTERFSDNLRSVIAVKQNVIIDSFDLRQAGEGTTVTIHGIAPTRDDLLGFKSRLEARFATQIDLPISQLARNTNPPFTLKFTVHRNETH